jgi:hypothetical protein
MLARFILWSILLTLLVRSLVRLLNGVLEGAGYSRRSAAPKSVGLVRDPVCGVFVVPGEALSLGEGTERRYFCCEKCRREWTVR